MQKKEVEKTQEDLVLTKRLLNQLLNQLQKMLQIRRSKQNKHLQENDNCQKQMSHRFKITY